MTEHNGEPVPPATVAAEVADRYNNPGMEGWLRLHLEAIEREGFAVVRVHSGRTESP